MLDRTLAPAFQKTISLVLPDPLEISFSSGEKMFCFPWIRQNIIKVEVVFRSGKWNEPKTGLSHFTSMMLEKGTLHHSSSELAEALDRYGASLEISPGFDFVAVSLYALKEKIKSIFPIFLEILTEPSFAEREWLQMKEIFLQNLKVNNEKTSYLASKIIRESVFGLSHPYGSSIEESDVQGLLPADLNNFFQASFRVHSVYIVGNIPDADLAFLHRQLEALAFDKTPWRTVPITTSVTSARRVDLPGKSQSSLRLGKKSLLKTDSDYPDVLLTSHLLGGFFGSRLMKNIREEKGLTYGISSSVTAFLHDGLFLIGADVNKENVDLAMAEIRKEVELLMAADVGDQELTLSKNHFIGSLQTDMANPFSVQEKIKNICVNGLPKDYYQRLLSRMDEIKPEDIREIAGKYLRWDSLAEVVVG